MNETPPPDAPQAALPRWHPVLPAADLAAGIDLSLGFMAGEELALWRAADGAPQAWANRCPHRGLRFTLGRLVGDRLACAYHGWEFQAGDGRCVAIPAHPDMRVPRGICATTYRTAQQDGMVWASAGVPAAPPPSNGIDTIVRTLGVDVPPAFAAAALLQAGWTALAPDVFGGALAGAPVTLYLTHAAATLVLLHAGVAGTPETAQVARLHAALRTLRDDLEAQHAARETPP
ncbi:Rieske-like 2Fe-2S protein [Pseudoduganella lurida]|uniref:Rieske-like 2Fe-2S protein n=1 Tax=Pseudoduganella lurida TaxID=1036180 RepID=A0A562R0Q7_9BURK|nr:Rieske 2Fe-2S domain-containing protein [Pseudoduganella lurida]TWI62655.1 Rieske-like 2Fe-2S protein [Pseudoduganella lurida]